MMVKMMSFRNQIWSDDNDDGEDDELQKPDLEWSKMRCEEARSRCGRKVYITSFFDDNDDGEDDELQIPDLEWTKRGCEKARLGSGEKN